jgi:hypothetical protein
MARFTIRDLLLLTVIVAVGTAWWIDRRRLTIQKETLLKEVDELRGAYIKIAFELDAARMWPPSLERMNELLEGAKKAPLASDEVQEVLFEVRHGDEFRTRVRAMAILPYLREREDAIDALRAALRERGESSADGVVPQYAATYLADMKANDAVNDVRAWVDFIKKEQPYDAEMRHTILESSEKSLAKLIAETQSPE